MKKIFLSLTVLSLGFLNISSAHAEIGSVGQTICGRCESREYRDDRYYRYCWQVLSQNDNNSNVIPNSVGVYSVRCY